MYYRDELCGVMVGFLDQNTVANVLSTDLYGCPADTYVMDGDGTTLGSSVRSGRTEAQSLADLADKLAEGPGVPGLGRLGRGGAHPLFL